MFVCLSLYFVSSSLLIVIDIRYALAGYRTQSVLFNALIVDWRPITGVVEFDAEQRILIINLQEVALGD